MAVPAPGIAVRNRALCAALIAFTQQTGCADSHRSSHQPIPTAAMSGTSPNTAMAASRAIPPIAGQGGADSMEKPNTTAGAQSAKPATAPAISNGPVSCNRERFPALPAGCPAKLPTTFSKTCTLPDLAVCRYLFGDGSKTNDSVAELSCRVEDGQASWSVSSAPCRHDCAIPPGGTPLVRKVDDSTCAERLLEPCGDGATVQAQVDAMLREVVRAPDAPWLNLNEDALYVEFENGCPTRLHTAWSQVLDGVDPLLETLSHVRWSCAVELTCGVFEGPSTLVTP